VVLGLFVVVVVAIGFAFWRRPAHEFQRIRGFRVEVRQTEGDETRTFHFNVPVSLLAQLTRLAKIDDALDGDIRAAWDREEITPRAILEAADASAPDKPGVIETDDAKVEVRSEGDAILIDVEDDWDHDVHVRVPRSLIELFADDEPISARDILRRLDELDAGDVVTIRDKHDEITITAQPRKGRMRISWFDGFCDFPAGSFG
jgi:hypothetical protein